MKKIFALISLSLLFTSIIITAARNPSTAYPLLPQAPIRFGGDMHMIDSADFNHDGNNDLVITDGKTIRGIGILYGLGNGTFATPLLIGDTNPYEWGLKVADVNNDTWADIVVANGDLVQLQIYINDGTGAFLPEFYIPLPDVGHGNLDIADVNDDGFLDIAVPGQYDAFHLLLNDTTGNFSVASTIPGSVITNHEELAFGDINMDGMLDIATTAPNSNLVEIFYGDGIGNFTFDHDFVAVSAYGIRIKDVDNDSVNELIFTQHAIGQDVLITDKNGSLKYSIPASSAVYVRVEDINLDGQVDIIYSDESVVGIKVALGNGLGFDAPVDYYVDSSPLGVAVKDFDGDGLPDVAAVNHGNTLSIFLTQGPSSVPGVTLIGTPVSQEGGANGQLQVVLNSNPSDTVFVNFSSTGGQSDFPTQDTLCFVPTGAIVNPGTPYDPCSTWNVAQTLNIGAVDDIDIEGTHSDILNANVNSNDTGYNGLAVADTNVTIYDNEVPPIPSIKITTTLDPSSVLLNELGPSSDTFNISLVGIPTSNVTMSCASNEPSQATFSPSLASYIVAPINASVERAYTVTAVDDPYIEGTQTYTIDCVSSSADPNFDNLIYKIPVKILDNDTVALTDTDNDGDPNTTDPDDDGDNIKDAVENGAANAGDGNEDGIIDSLQASVASAPNSISGKYMTFVLLGSTCTKIQSYTTNSELDNVTLDDYYSYPIGFSDFVVNCTNPGDTALIRWILDSSYDTSSWAYRKFLSSSDAYFDLPSVSFTTVNIAGTIRTVIDYKITDGSPYDDDVTTDATISDPNGPAIATPAPPVTSTTTAPVSASTTPNTQASNGHAQGGLVVTGFGGETLLLTASILLVVGIVFARVRSKRIFIP